MLRFNVRELATAVGWALVIASIVLRALYSRPSLTEPDIVLLFLGSALVGSVLTDVGKLVVGFVEAVLLAMAVSYFGLILPTLLGIAGAAGEAMYSGAVIMIFRTVFPIPLIIILFGGFLGSIIGELLLKAL